MIYGNMEESSLETYTIIIYTKLLIEFLTTQLLMPLIDNSIFININY